VEHVATREKTGNYLISSVNSFLVLSDDAIIDKDLEVGIYVSSLSIETMHMLRDLNLLENIYVQRKRNWNSKDKMLKKIIKSREKVESQKLIAADNDAKTDINQSDIDDDFTPVISKRMKKLEK
jgi:hypothetical protein